MTDGEKQIWAALYAASYHEGIKWAGDHGQEITAIGLYKIIATSVEEASFGVRELRRSKNDLMKNTPRSGPEYECLTTMLEAKESPTHSVLPGEGFSLV